MNTRMRRRSFLRTAAAAGVSLPYLIPSHVLGGPNKPGANERVNVGIIGLGGRAQDIAGTCFAVPQVRLAAVCDCFTPRVNDFAKRINRPQTWKTYEDFRKMIDKEKLDAVMVETTTHARAWIAMLAMQAGMDAYIEKPMCLTIAEGRAMVKRRAEIQPRHAGRHAAAVDADQQLGQRPGQERRVASAHRARAELRRAGQAGPTARPADAQRRQQELVGHVDQPGRPAAVP